MSKQKDKGFVQIPNWYFECGLTLIEVNTLAQIASYQREDKEFFQSAETLASRFSVSYSHMRKVLDDLVKKRIIKKDGKVKRMWKYKIDANVLSEIQVKVRLQKIKDAEAKKIKDASNDCATTKHNKSTKCHQEVVLLPPRSNYNTNNTSLNKTSVRGNESILDRSSPTKTEVLDWATDINLDK